MNLPNWDTWFHVLKYLIVMGLVLWFGLFFFIFRADDLFSSLLF